MSNKGWSLQVFPGSVVKSETRDGNNGAYTTHTQSEVYLEMGLKFPVALPQFRVASAEDRLPEGTHEIDMSSVATVDQYGKLVPVPSARWKIWSSLGAAKSKAA